MTHFASSLDEMLIAIFMYDFNNAEVFETRTLRCGGISGDLNVCETENDLSIENFLN